jgi:hypothetical protein
VFENLSVKRKYRERCEAITPPPNVRRMRSRVEQKLPGQCLMRKVIRPPCEVVWRDLDHLPVDLLGHRCVAWEEREVRSRFARLVARFLSGRIALSL